MPSIFDGYRLGPVEMNNHIRGAPIVSPDSATFCTGGKHGYIDYPALGA